MFFNTENAPEVSFSEVIPSTFRHSQLVITGRCTHGQLPTATRVVKIIREQIREELNLTASAGVAPNKFLAEIASEMGPKQLFRLARFGLRNFQASEDTAALLFDKGHCGTPMRKQNINARYDFGSECGTSPKRCAFFIADPSDQPKAGFYERLALLKG